MREEECRGAQGLTKYRLAEGIGVPAQRVGEIVGGESAVTADTDFRLCR
jgi:plasmid maintenance system antidote protein VapI